jgi:hypothetical protein
MGPGFRRDDGASVAIYLGRDLFRRRSADRL